MSKTIELTDEQWAAYERGEPVTVQKLKPWEPEGGLYIIEWAGSVHRSRYNDKKNATFGMRYATEDTAIQARNLMYPIHRYIAYAMEHWPDYEVPPSGTSTSYVAYNDDEEKWFSILNWNFRDPWIPYGPRDKVKELADRLNRGEVKF